MSRCVPIIERLLSRVVVTESGCWEFTGPKTAGYGIIGLEGGRGAGTDRAHRVAYRHFVGEIPPGMQLDHLCRNRACCNPEHLEPVTPAENTRRGIHRAASITHCVRGHRLPEYVKGQRRICMECRREDAPARRESDRRRYWADPDAARERRRIRYQNNIEAERARARDYQRRARANNEEKSA